MRKIIVDNNEVIIDEESDRHVSRNVDADLVGFAKSLEVDYDELGSAEVEGGKTIKIESSPEGEEFFTYDVPEGQTATVYWAVKYS